MTENRLDRAGDGETIVVSSEVTISPERGERSEQAFRDRLHLAEAASGFHRLEVWRDIKLAVSCTRVPDGVLVGRCAVFSRRHAVGRPPSIAARIPTGADRPHASGLRRYRRVPDAGVSDGA